MASIIRVKRSTGTGAPSSLNFGELGLTVGVGTHGNKGGRLFAGDNSSNTQVVGGRYYTDLLSTAPGLVAGQANPTTAANGFVAILDSSRKVDQWNVDNITLDGNTVSSTNTDGDINIDPNGSGEIVIPDDTFLTFGSSKDAKIEYDEASTDKIQVTGADWNYADGVQIVISDTTQSTSKDTGALVVEGGVGIEKDLNIGGNFNVTGITTFANNLDIAGDIDVDGRTELDTTNISEFLNVVGVSTFAAAVDFNGSIDVDGHTELDFVNVSAASTFAGLIDINAGGQANTFKVEDLTENRVTIAGVGGELEDDANFTFDGSTLTLGGSVNLSVAGNSTLTGNVVSTGNFNNTGISTFSGRVEIDNVGISSNVISTKSGGGNTLFIDPYPDGLSNEGTVIVKGDLQVDGTTTTVNSTSVSVNDAVFAIGDVSSKRTVMGTVNAGVSTVLLDSVVGINTGDQLAVTGIDNSGIGTVTGYNTSTKVVTYTGTAVAPGVAVEAQVTITHGFDTSTDRGISFQYNDGNGVTNTKTGFFGFNDSAGEASSAVAKAWTYIPNATITNSVVAGTRGFLDIKGIYYQTGDYNTHGVSYFDANGLLTSTNNPSTASNTLTSTQILTAVTEITLALPSAITVSVGDLITQSGGNQQGVVKTAVTGGTSITLIGVTGTFTDSADLIKNGTGSGITPDSATVVYTNKPMWTNTLDGGTF